MKTPFLESPLSTSVSFAPGPLNCMLLEAVMSMVGQLTVAVTI
eukprot:CAMPEP_0114118314 /NCGR_PEP_ID=MMETSP0043_2-20121206/5516_1 /TAXON_ID=464988 /ORGANISM="Hemiselmis andersenii, Strain CCMP644" /LENGTH=42 /DNA_ID= /DNA_START= /DNA_END= /DNA_ORIENTATION=